MTLKDLLDVTNPNKLTIQCGENSIVIDASETFDEIKEIISDAYLMRKVNWIGCDGEAQMTVSVI